MELSQIYQDATNAFQYDPELRNLLLQTMNAAQNTAMPPMVNIAQQSAAVQDAYGQQRPGPGKSDRLALPAPGNPADGNFPMMDIARARAPMENAMGQQQSAPGKTDMLPPAPGAPPPGPAGPGYNPMTAFAPNAMSGRGAPAPNPAPGGPVMPRPAAGPAGPAVAASTGGADPMRQIAAFLQGLGTSDAILPAIGGGMANVQNLERQDASRSQTVRALMNRGLDADSAQAAAQNPEILKAVLPQLFGGNTDRTMGSDFDPVTGRERKFFYNQKGPANVEYIGGSKSDPGTTSVSRAQGTANVKRVEKYKSEADSARGLIANLGEIEALRKNAPDLLKGLPPGMGTSIARWTDYFGATDGVMALSPKELDIQLGFTERTKGAITDREMGLFAGGVPGLGMTDAAADTVIAGMRAAANRKVEQSKFYEAWLGKNRGSLEGAQDAWDSYINANPIITRNRDGSLSINNKNVGNWKEYVDGDDQGIPSNDGPVSSGITGLGDNEPGSGGATDVDRYPTVNTQEEFDALPPGAVYIDVDEGTGKRTQYTKPKR